ncbi:MAG: dihydroorotase [Prevotellaceae bacterium]|nr:dihydroorotase [Prevotellaceae bacterium]
MRNFIIYNGTIVNEGRQAVGSLVITDGRIAEVITEANANLNKYTDHEIIDAKDCYVLPGIIDTHVHFREPGLTHKADIASESRAAAFGGITSYFDMPNTNPQTTTLEALREKQALAKEKSLVNWTFFPGATNDNIEEIEQMDASEIPGIKLFMGSSTGNMLVDKYGSLIKIFQSAAKSGLVVMAHCEDTEIINANMKKTKEQMGEDPDVMFHPIIRSEEACMESSCLAANLARQTGAKLHIAHISTEAELNAIYSPTTSNELPQITSEATVAHLMFDNNDYRTIGARIKCNPAIKKPSDKEALRKGLMNGQISTIGTDHAPHCIEEKQGGAAKAMSGMPMIQFSLTTMLSLVDEGVLSIEKLVQLMAHNPAKLFDVEERGFIREGYKADITIVKPQSPWTVTKECIQSKCGWSPMEGRTYNWQVRDTICNGNFVLRDGKLSENNKGEQIRFNHSK